MPDLYVADWIDGLGNECLSEMLVEALVARRSAIRAGALAHRATKSIIESGDATLEQIKYGRYRGTPACKRAATIIRKYTEAMDLASEKREHSRSARHLRHGS